MATPVQDLYPHIFQEVQELRMHWEMFLALYGLTEERVALLQQTAPVTFGLIQERIRDWILLRLAQLASKPKEGGHHQVCFESLIVALPASAPTTEKLQGALITFRKQTETAEVWRDKRIAHFDQNSIVGPDRLPEILRREIAAAMDTAVAILMLIESAVHGSGFVQTDRIPCDVERLMKRLEG